MLFDLLSMALMDGGGWYNSPFIIPVAGCAMILGIVASGAWARVRSQEIKSQERLARIAHGLPVEPDWNEATVKAAAAPISEEPAGFQGYRALKQYHKRLDDGAGARRAGLILVSIGVGLFAFFAALSAIVRVREVLSGGAAGLIPFAIGIGFLIDARLKKQEHERRISAPWYAAPEEMGFAAPGQATPPPPPPAGMSAAQASDWQCSSTLK